jgi:hypothetical protein
MPLLVPPAGAHGPAGGGVGYVSTVGGLQPPVLGVIANVLGGDDRLQLVNYSGKTIVVRGYDGEPFLRFTSDGVYENIHSRTTYLSRVRDQAGVAVPASATVGAAPSWSKATEGSTFVWHDRRIRWTGVELPAVIKAAPDETHLIFRWRVPARVDAQPFAVTGFLGYRPLPKSPDGTSPWLIAAVVGASVLAFGALGVGARRMKRQAPASEK